MRYFKHPHAIVESDMVGDNTRIWAFAHILPGVQIGVDCNICSHVFIENDVKIGDRVTIKSGVQLWNGTLIEDDVFIGPNATFTNDMFPRSKQYPEKYEKTMVCKGASVGANATILAGITIGKNAMVGAGSVVTRNVPPNAIVVGNPAIIKGYVDSNLKHTLNSKKIKEIDKTKEIGEKIESVVSGVKIFKLPIFNDIRGSVAVAEYGQYLPFVPKRSFFVFDVPSREVRGEHAHKELHQFQVCVRGSCSIVVDDGRNREEILLNSVEIGLYIPPMIWGIQYKYSPDAVLLVLASDIYKAEDYIKDYDEFLKAVKNEA